MRWPLLQDLRCSESWTGLIRTAYGAFTNMAQASTHRVMLPHLASWCYPGNGGILGSSQAEAGQTINLAIAYYQNRHKSFLFNNVSFAYYVESLSRYCVHLYPFVSILSNFWPDSFWGPMLLVRAARESFFWDSNHPASHWEKTQFLGDSESQM